MSQMYYIFESHACIKRRNYYDWLVDNKGFVRSPYKPDNQYQMEEVQLQSGDGVLFPISRRALKRSQLLSSVAEDKPNCGIIKLRTVTSSALAKVVEYLEEFECIVTGPESGQSFIPKKKIELDDDDDSVTGEDSKEQHESELEDRYCEQLTAYINRFLESMTIPHLVEVTKAADYLVIYRLFRMGFRRIVYQLDGLNEMEIRTKMLQLMRPDPQACRGGQEAEGC